MGPFFARVAQLRVCRFLITLQEKGTFHVAKSELEMERVHSFLVPFHKMC